jgi:isopenicillin N synthase-like dioxygenase
VSEGRIELEVPVIDLAGDRAVNARRLDAAASAIGFFQVVGHDVPVHVRDHMLEATSAFFAQSSAAKLACRPPVPEINRGYSARASEGLAYSVGVARPADLFEAFNIGPDDPDLANPVVAAERHRHFAANIWPDTPPDFRAALVAWFAAARAVADRIVDLFAPALGLPDGWCAPFTTHSTDTLRVNHYETAPGDAAPLDGQMGMGEHTDYGICAVLYGERCSDGSAGLQIIGPDGDWVDVAAQPGALLVNLGDLTAQWTNDRWRSTLHRVVPLMPLADRVNRRRSVAFFHDGNHDALIECLPTCHDAAHPPKYPPVTAGDHLMAKLMGPRTLRASVATQTVGDRLGR